MTLSFPRIPQASQSMRAARRASPVYGVTLTRVTPSLSPLHWVALSKSGSNDWTWSFTSSDGPDESQLVTINADDGNGGSTQYSFDLTVNNVAPAAVAIESSVAEAVFAVGGLQHFAGSFADASPVDTHTGTWTFTHLDEQGVLVSETQTASVPKSRCRRWHGQ